MSDVSKNLQPGITSHEYQMYHNNYCGEAKIVFGIYLSNKKFYVVFT